MGDHRVDVASVDKKAVLRRTEPFKIGQGMVMRLGNHAHGVALCLQYTRNDSDAKTGVIDITVAGHADKIELVDSPLFHLLFGRLTSLKRADNAHLFHFINQTCRTRIAKLQSALQVRSRSLSRFNHTFDRGRQHIILLVESASAGTAASFLSDRLFFNLVNDLLVILGRFFMLNKSNDLFHFFFSYKATLYTQRFWKSDRIKQHIAPTKQFFRAASIQDSTGIYLRTDRKGNTAWNIRFNKTSDNIHRRTLGGDDKMHTGGARHLCQTADGIFHLIGSRHHQVGKLVNDNDDLRQFFKFI